MSFSFIDLIREFLEIVGAITIISKVISYLVGRRELRKIEESYSKARGYIEEKLPDMSFTLNYLPDAIVLEKATKGERGLSSILTTGIKKIIQKIKGRHYYHIIVFDDLSLPQQIAFILKKTFEAIFPFQNVLEIDLRECLVIYYSYKFAKASEKLVGTETIDLLEKELQKNRYKDMIINLDSKELESNITLNPPPEIRPLLDRVIIPILRLKAQKMASITDISMIESTKTKMRNFLDRLSRGLIGVLFIGRKIPEEYLNYIKQKISLFNGLLVCSRGRLAFVQENLEEEIFNLLRQIFNITDLKIITLEGKLLSESGEQIPHRYTFISIE